MSAVSIRDGNNVEGGGAGAFGIQCFATASMTASATTLTESNLGDVIGTAGSTTGCNVFQ